MRRCVSRNSLLILSTVILFFSGCTYYNTFYNARKSFKEGEKAQEKTAPERRASVGQTQYEEAIKKASKVLTFHPKSKWADDALFMIGRAYFNMQDYVKAGRKFEELVSSFPKSNLVDESHYYISLCHYYSGEETQATKQLKDFLESKKIGKKRKGEASFLLAQMYYDRGDYQDAMTYYDKTLNEFNPDTLAAITEFQLGQCLWEQKDYERAQEAFVKVEDRKPSTDLLFDSKFRQGECWYLLGDYQKGMEIYQKLSQDQAFAAKLSSITLKMAQGQYHLGELCLSMMKYYEVTEKYPRTEESANAYFALGEIYQDDFGSLEEAKKMYDAASTEKRDSPVAKEALTRSANISRIEEYYQELSDQDAQESGKALFLLGELYLTQMDDPDSAQTEYLALVSKFPQSEYAAKALYAAAWIAQNVKHDSTQAEELCQRVVAEYPHSDYLAPAVCMLGASRDTMNVVSPEEAYLWAESLLVVEGQVDSALARYHLIMEQYPNSEYAGKAAFARAWTIEQYANPGDSTVIFAYQKVIDQYPESEYAEEARIKLGLSQRVQPTTPVAREAVPAQEEPDSTLQAAAADTSSGPQFPKAPDLPLKRGDFIYPESETYTGIQGAVVLKIRIALDGSVAEAQVVSSLDNVWIDDAAKEAALNTIFDADKIDPEQLGGYFLYTVEVKVPQNDPLLDQGTNYDPYKQ
jgi:TonB family protein